MEIDEGALLRLPFRAGQPPCVDGVPIGAFNGDVLDRHPGRDAKPRFWEGPSGKGQALFANNQREDRQQVKNEKPDSKPRPSTAKLQSHLTVPAANRSQKPDHCETPVRGETNRL